MDAAASAAQADAVAAIASGGAGGPLAALAPLIGEFRGVERHPIRFDQDGQAVMGLGGTIDYEARTLERPASWITDSGLEWLYRLVSEPRLRWRGC